MIVRTGAAGLPPVTISFEDCDAIGNHAGWTLTTAYPGLPGSVEVVRGTTSGSLSHGIGIYNKAASALGVSFRDHQVWNVSTGGSACTDVDAAKLCPDGKPVNAPVALFIRDGTPEKEGGVNLSNLSVADSRDRPWLQVIGDSNRGHCVACADFQDTCRRAWPGRPDCTDLAAGGHQRPRYHP